MSPEFWISFKLDALHRPSAGRSVLHTLFVSVPKPWRLSACTMTDSNSSLWRMLDLQLEQSCRSICWGKFHAETSRRGRAAYSQLIPPHRQITPAYSVRANFARRHVLTVGGTFCVAREEECRAISSIKTNCLDYISLSSPVACQNPARLERDIRGGCGRVMQSLRCVD